MGAPKGNEFWKLRSKHGREKLFKTPELMWEAACEYFEWIVANPISVQDNKGTKNVNTIDFIRPFTLVGLCIYLDCSSSYFRTFKSLLKKKDKEYLTIITRIEEIIYNQKFEGAAIGIFKENIIARDLGLTEKKEIDLKTSIPKKIGFDGSES